MATLLIDTTYFLTVGILGHRPFCEESSTDHVEKIAPLAARAMEEAGGKVEKIEVMAGPGPFTGLRAGLAFATGLSLSLAVPLSAASLLFAEDLWARSEGAKVPVVAVNNARRRQAYFQIFSERGEDLSSMDIASPDKIAQSALALGRPVALAGLAGDYFDKISCAFSEAKVPFTPFLRPAGSARWLESMHESVKERPLPPRPIYLRDADAVPLFAPQGERPQEILAKNLLWSLN